MAGRRKEDGVDYDEDLDQIDFNNYKGMFFNDDPGQKYQDEVTGAHFEYHDMCRRLKRLQKEAQIEVCDEPTTGATKETTEGEAQRVPNESGQALQTLQSLLGVGRVKESRNVIQALPQQGYGTVGAYHKEPLKATAAERNPSEANAIEHKNLRQMSNQPELPGKAKVVRNQASNRSKSIDKPQVVPPKVANVHMMNDGLVLLKAPGKHTIANKLPTSALGKVKGTSVKRNTVYDMQGQFVQHPSQKSIEQLLDDKMKSPFKCRPSTNHRTKTIDIGVEPISSKAPADTAKSRNAASRAQDRKTCDKVPRSEKKEDGKFFHLYQTTADKSEHKRSRDTIGRKEVVVPMTKTKTKTNPKSKPADPEKLKKLRVSLIGSEVVPCYSRNAMPAKTSVKEVQKDKLACGKATQPRKSQPHYGSKRTYVASLLQPWRGVIFTHGQQKKLTNGRSVGFESAHES